MPFIIFLILIFMYNIAYSSEFFQPNTYTFTSLSYENARDYHFNSANIKKYKIKTYEEYNNLLSKNISLNLSLDFITLNLSIGDSNYAVFLLIGTSNDAIMRPDGNGAGYITFWQQKGDKFNLIASNEIYAIYGASLYFDDENNTIIIDSPMGQCEVMFLKTVFNISKNKVYYNLIEKTIIANGKIETKIFYDKQINKPILLHEKNGIDILESNK